MKTRPEAPLWPIIVTGIACIAALIAVAQWYGDNENRGREACAKLHAPAKCNKMLGG